MYKKIILLLSFFVIGNIFADDDYQAVDNGFLAQSSLPIYSYKILRTYPHDTSSFTEGLIYFQNFLYESTGLNGQSKLRKIDLPTGKVLRQINLPPQYFGEGITILNQKIYQLTYQSHIGFVYDFNTWQLQRYFSYATEGWGLTTNGKQLIMSDGTANLYFLDPQSFRRLYQIKVHDGNKLIDNVNELEYIDHKIYANIWRTDLIAIISPADGHLMGWINLEKLHPASLASAPEDVLNGIAYDPKDQALLVTGKNWPHIYAIQIIQRVK